MLNNIALGKLAGFVVIGPMTVSRDRSSLNDGPSSAGFSGDARQQTLQELSVIVFQKVTESSSGGTPLDNMQDIARFIIKVLAGFRPPTNYAIRSDVPLRFLNHSVLEYDTGIYSHIVQFELLADIATEDLDKEPVSVAFRDIAMTLNNNLGDQDITAAIDLDDEPL